MQTKKSNVIDCAKFDCNIYLQVIQFIKESDYFTEAIFF